MLRVVLKFRDTVATHVLPTRPYLSSSFPALMAREMKSSVDPEYIMRPVSCSGRISKMAANSSRLRTSGGN